MKPLNSGIQWLLSFYVMISGIAFCAQGYRKQTGNWKLETESWKLQAVNWKLQAASCELETAGCKLRTDP